jgi:hypothetical protein
MLIYKVGRGLRLSPATGKKDCLIIDVVDRIQDSGLVATPALFGQDYVPDKTPVTPEKEEPDTEKGVTTPTWVGIASLRPCGLRLTRLRPRVQRRRWGSTIIRIRASRNLLPRTSNADDNRTLLASASTIVRQRPPRRKIRVAARPVRTGYGR